MKKKSVYRKKPEEPKPPAELKKVIFAGRAYEYTERVFGNNGPAREYTERVQKEIAEACLTGRTTRFKIASALKVSVLTVNKWVEKWKGNVTKTTTYKRVKAIEKFLNKIDEYKFKAGNIDYESSILVKQTITETVERLKALIPGCDDVGQLATALRSLVALDEKLSQTVTSPQNQSKFAFYQYIDKQIVDKQLNVKSDTDGDTDARTED